MGVDFTSENRSELTGPTTINMMAQEKRWYDGPEQIFPGNNLSTRIFKQLENWKIDIKFEWSDMQKKKSKG